MYLSESDAQILKDLGFERPYFEKVEPFDVYSYKGEHYSVGGKMHTRDKFLLSEEILENGIWIPNAYDLLQWFEKRELNLVINLNHKNLNYKVDFYHEDGEFWFKIKNTTLEGALFKGLEKILSEQKR